MSFTSGQYNKFKNHASLKWLIDCTTRGQLLSQDTIKIKIKQAIDSAFSGRATEQNITWVANQIGVLYGQVHKPKPVVSGKVNIKAVNEIRGVDKNMAQAVTMIFNGTAKGRSAPGTTGINHIHVGGVGVKNILFDLQKNVILGIVDGHMQKNMTSVIRNQVDKVNKRKGGATQNMQVVGSSVK